MSELGGLSRLRLVGRVLVVLALAAGALYALRHRHAALDPIALSGVLAVHPNAVLLFLTLHIAASLLFIPRTVLAMAAGLVFGTEWGLLWATIGSVLGAVAGFVVARYLNSGLIDLESMPRLGPVLQRAEAGGWRAVAALRLIPVIPHSLANYALGLTRLPIGQYALGSVLGQLPMTVASVELGAAGGRMWAGTTGWLMPTLIGAAALLASLLLPRVARLKS
ncbi:MAG TPA: VTT domain-containing protein [Stellaceae bacterium]|nr:VTT domain-containing protein [Stellaceae bacterium]